MGAPEIIMARRQIEIDRDKLRAAIRQLPHEYAFYMLDDAIDLLSPPKLHKVVRKYLDLRHSTSSSASWIASTSAGKTSSFSQTRRGPGRSVPREKVLPPWLKVLSATAEPEEFAQQLAETPLRLWERQDACHGAEDRDTGATTSAPQARRASNSSTPSRVTTDPRYAVRCVCDETSAKFSSRAERRIRTHRRHFAEKREATIRSLRQRQEVQTLLRAALRFRFSRRAAVNKRSKHSRWRTPCK
jgi:hypothetical protein